MKCHNCGAEYESDLMAGQGNVTSADDALIRYAIFWQCPRCSGWSLVSGGAATARRVRDAEISVVGDPNATTGGAVALRRTGNE